MVQSTLSQLSMLTCLQKTIQIQTEQLLKKEAEGQLEGPFNVLISHAQDYVMTGMAMNEMAKEIVNLYAKVRAAK